MKSFIKNQIIKPIAQVYANYLVFMLGINIKTEMGGLDMYEQIMSMAVTFDYVCTEELGIDLD